MLRTTGLNALQTNVSASRLYTSSYSLHLRLHNTSLITRQIFPIETAEYTFNYSFNIHPSIDQMIHCHHEAITFTLKANVTALFHSNMICSILHCACLLPYSCTAVTLWHQNNKTTNIPAAENINYFIFCVFHLLNLMPLYHSFLLSE